MSSLEADPLPAPPALPGTRRGNGQPRNAVSGAARQPVLILDLEGKAFGRSPVLGQISLTLRPGETLAITGPSGIGKSTLLRIIAGLDPDFRGRITRPDRIAMVFQEPTLLPWRKARENLTLTTGIGGREAETAMAEVGLAGMGDLFPGQMSLGQQRRLALARAFAAQPELLLMDEPFVSLDVDRSRALYALFEEMRARNPVATILVTHDLAEAERLADRVLTLDGTPAVLTAAG